MMSLVYHCNDQRGKCRHFPKDYDLVAMVRSVKLEEVLELTNSIDSHWSNNRKVKVIKQSRSTTVGDVVVTPMGAFRFSFEGWERFTFKNVNQLTELLKGKSSRSVLSGLRAPPPSPQEEMVHG